MRMKKTCQYKNVRFGYGHDVEFANTKIAHENMFVNAR